MKLRLTVDDVKRKSGERQEMRLFSRLPPTRLTPIIIIIITVIVYHHHHHHYHARSQSLTGTLWTSVSATQPLVATLAVRQPKNASQ